MLNSLAFSKSLFRTACTEYIKRKAESMRVDVHAKTAGHFDRQLWSATLDYFRGSIDAFGFIDAFTSAIQEQYTKAWNEGADEVGVLPDDMTSGDMAEIERIIQDEYNHILPLAEDIEEAINSQVTLNDFRSQFRPRIDLWVNRYNEIVNQSKIWFGGKLKMEWRLGATEEHCETCSRLDGIVAFGYEWDQSGIKPQSAPNPILECGGWRCDCSLVVTDKRRSASALETLMEIATARHL